MRSQLRFEVRQRFIEEKDLGLAHNGPANGHALALPARQGGGLAVEHVVDAQQFGRVHDPLVDLGFGGFAQAQTESHVVVQALVRVQRIVLKHH